MIEPYWTNPELTFQLYYGDCRLVMHELEMDGLVPIIITDPPYFISTGGSTCESGKRAKVDKGEWDDPEKAPGGVYDFTHTWLAKARQLLTPDGSIWVCGTEHNIHLLAYLMERLGFDNVNDITWVKPNPPPNLGCRTFTHATETLLWRKHSDKSRHVFNYDEMKAMNEGKQMRSDWRILPPGKDEKRLGKYKTQKPLELMERALLACRTAGDVVLDPFCGSGTTGMVAAALDHPFIGIDNSEKGLNLTIARYRAWRAANKKQPESRQPATQLPQIGDFA